MELQAITCQFIDRAGILRKALLALPQLLCGYAGIEQGPKVMSVLAFYKIKSKLSYITSDNHGANDTIGRYIEEQLVEQGIN